MGISLAECHCPSRTQLDRQINISPQFVNLALLVLLLRRGEKKL